MRLRLLGGGALGLVGVAVCALVAVHGYRQGKASASSAPNEPLTLPDALRVSRRLGAVAPSTRVHLVISLRSRHQHQLERMFLSGEGGSPGQAASLLAPSTALVERALAAARRAGFTTSWAAGDGIASLTGPPRSVAALLGVQLSRYVSPGGRDFYAGDRNPVLPAAFGPVVTGIAGLDDFEQMKPAAIPQYGAGPTDMLKFYDVAPLQAAGLDGAGETIVFPEWINPADFAQIQRDLGAFSTRFALPTADLTLMADQSWAPFASGAYGKANVGEAELDVEVAHEIAPKATLIMYAMGVSAAGYAGESALVKEHPTAIMSLSYGNCELPMMQNKQYFNVAEHAWYAVAAANMTAYVATGDSGAYECGQSASPAVWFPASVPIAAAIGGTTAFFGPGSAYGSEIAWGDALTQWGSGGGLSRIYARPAWQTGSEFPSTRSAPARLTPDASAMACTCWAVVMSGQNTYSGGTSAATPFWAAITALIDEDLVKHGLRRVGIPNRALVWIAAHQSTYGAFHDVTAGNNFLYVAGRGWDAATGFGSPDVARLDTAWKAYIRAGGR
jgi:hypothetical protein